MKQMRLDVHRGEEKLEDLARRLYHIEGKGSRERLARATRALRDANPSLRRMRDVQPGAVVVVPDVEGVPRSEDEPAIKTGDVVKVVIGRVDEALKSFASTLSDVTAAERAAAAETANAVKAARSRVESRKDHDRLTSAEKRAKERVEEAKALRSLYRAGVRDLASDLEEFLGSIS